MSHLMQLYKLALPMVVGQLAFAAMSFIDTLLMGRLGVQELAGGGLGSVVFQFCHVVGLGVLVATANLIAFSKGQNKPESIHSALLSGCVITVILSILFGTFIWFAKPILLFMGQEPEIVAIADVYLKSVVWALLPAYGFILMRSLVLGVGDPSAILPISIAAAILNYPVSYVLMTGQFGLPALGVRGIAYGTCIISFGMVLGLIFLVYRKPQFKPYKLWQNWDLFSFTQLRETLSLGIPIAIAHAMEIGLFSAGALLVGLVGVNALAAHQVALQCATVSFMIPLGISQAVSVKVGEHFGAKDASSIKIVTKQGLLLVTISACLAGSVFWLVPDWLVSLFLTDISPEKYDDVLQVAVSVLFVAALFQLVDGWQVVLMGVLRGFKLGVSPTIATVVSYWLVGFPSAYLLLQYWGAVGVWSGLGVGLGASAIMLAVLYSRVYRREFSVKI